MYNIFIHSSMGGDLGCFHVLAVVNDASVNPGRGAGTCLFELAVWGDIFPGVGLMCHMVVLSSVLGETPILFPQWLHLCTRLAALGARRGRRDSIPSLPPGPTPPPPLQPHLRHTHPPFTHGPAPCQGGHFSSLPRTVPVYSCCRSS